MIVEHKPPPPQQHQVSKDDLDRIKAQFSKLDKDDNGYIDINDMEQAKRNASALNLDILTYTGGSGTAGGEKDIFNL